MTTPLERTRNLVQVGAFLKELRAGASLPEATRELASRLLRHYPTVCQLGQMAKDGQGVLHPDMLTSAIDPAWGRSFEFGAHQD